jgi:hypothetical protein
MPGSCGTTSYRPIDVDGVCADAEESERTAATTASDKVRMGREAIAPAATQQLDVYI